MIILNHCKKSSEIIQRVLHKKPLASILYAEGIRSVTKYCETVIRSLQQHKYSVRHSGCHDEITQYSKAYLLQTEVGMVFKSLWHLFSQPVKALFNSESERRV